MKNSNCLILLLIILAIFLNIDNISALAPEERLADEKQEQRAFNLFLQVKCLVCEAQTIDSSNSEFAYQLRKLIRKKIIENKTDEQIKIELIAEFNDEIVTDSKITNKNYLFWLLPILFASLGLFFLKRRILK
jgi:cytochrome c-type biogenesis protein CcmH